MVDNFLNHLKFEKRYSAHTLTAYHSDLLQFTRFLVTNYDSILPEAALPQHFRTYLAQLLEDGISARSVQRKLITLRSFYKYLLQEGSIAINPLKRVKSPKSGSRLPEFIKENEMQKLHKDSDEALGFSGIRNELMVEMLYQTGMRLSELKNMKSSNINLLKGELKVTGKRNKERIIPFTDNLRDAINSYLIEKNKLTGMNPEYFFVLDNGKPLYEKFIYRVVTSALEKITSSEKKSPHVLRHTYATHLMNHGASISAIKELLGHSSLAATQIYTHNSIEQLKQAHEHSHPRA